MTTERMGLTMATTIKERILEATLEIATEKGLGRTSISQIADKVGLKKSSIYSHFSSKDQIVEEMYNYFRGQALARRSSGNMNYSELIDGRNLQEILTIVVNAYMSMNLDPQMFNFYRVIMTERSISKAAAEIMVAETKTMINATKNLFYAIQAKKLVDFGNPDAAAFSFAMGIHAVIEYVFDAKLAESHDADTAIDTYIEEFSRIYSN